MKLRCALTLFLMSWTFRTMAGEIALSDDGNVLAWTSENALYVSSAAHPGDFDSLALQEYFYPRNSEIALVLAGDGKSIFLSCGKVYRGQVENGSVDTLQLLDSCQLGAFWADVSYDGSLVTGILGGSDTSSRCRPEWIAITYLRLDMNRWVQSDPITSTSVCSFVRSPHYDESGAITFYVDDSAKIYQITPPYAQPPHHDISLRGFQLGYYPVSKNGNSLLVYRKRLMQSTGDSTLSLYCSEKMEGRWTEPMAILPEHRDAILWNSSISPDGNHICWLHLHRGADGNKIIKQQVFVIHRLGDGWSEPEPLFCVPDVQMGDLRLSDRNILLTTITGFQIYFFSALDATGNLFSINSAGIVKTGVGDLTGLDNQPVKTRVPVAARKGKSAPAPGDKGSYLLTGRRIPAFTRTAARAVTIHPPAYGQTTRTVRSSPVPTSRNPAR